MTYKLTLGSLLTVLLLFAVAAPAAAEQAKLQHDSGTADEMRFIELEEPLILFDAMPGWSHNIVTSVSFYCEKYGDVDGILGSIVIWSEQTEDTPTNEEYPGSLVNYAQQSFELSSLPDSPGWVTIAIPPVEVESNFAVSVHTYSNSERGVRFGLSNVETRIANSTQFGAGVMVEGEFYERYRGQEWMIRPTVVSTLVPSIDISAADLEGSNFSGYDDGSAEGFHTEQLNGMQVRFSNGYERRVSHVYIYGKLEGDWFRTNRQLSIYLLDANQRIIKSKDMSYSNFTDVPGWAGLSFEGTPVPSDFYVVVRPLGRPDISFNLGYDTSQENMGSSFGTVGTFQAWSTDAPEDSTNWMIRVEY